MEGKTNFSRDLKQFDGLARLTPTPDFTKLRCCREHCVRIVKLNDGNIGYRYVIIKT